MTPSAAPMSIVLIAEQMTSNCEMIAQRSAQRVAREIPTYSRIPFDEILAQAKINVGRGVQVLLSQQAPGPDEKMSDILVARDRFREGLPMEDMLRGYRISLGDIRDEFIACAERMGLDADLIVHGTVLLWELTDSATVQLSTAYREMSVEKALHDEFDRIDFLRRLLFGNASTEELHSLSRLYRLSTEGRYYAVRGRPGNGASLQTLIRQLEKSGFTSNSHGIVGVIDGDVAGLTAVRPTLDNLDAIIGVGPRVALHNAEHSFRRATRILDVANYFGSPGVFTLEDLSWRIGVVELPEVTETLVRRYIEPLNKLDEFGPVLKDTVREYLASGQRLGATAQKLIIHINTLRYRLERYQDIVGADLSSTNTVMEVLWALQAQQSAEI